MIMIFLDAERFIEQAIASVFAQTNAHWELLLVDDGSRDGSTTIAKIYAARHSDRVRYLEHPGHANRGTGASRNLGLAHAHGDYITFLDADDLFLPERLTQHVELLERRSDVDAVRGQVLFWRSWRGPGANDAEDVSGPSGRRGHASRASRSPPRERSSPSQANARSARRSACRPGSCWGHTDPRASRRSKCVMSGCSTPPASPASKASSSMTCHSLRSMSELRAARRLLPTPPRRLQVIGGPAHASAAHDRRLRIIAVERDRADRALDHACGSPPPSGDVRMRPRNRVEMDLARSR